MTSIAIQASSLSKQYHLGGQQAQYRTLREALTETVMSPFRRAGRLLRTGTLGPAQPGEMIWALKDVSFEVEQGEVLGIIGRNGAGKSTLLKVLSRITEPTSGYADVDGRVGSLLEVGTGFHPELTGRENVFLNGAILGMRREEINAKFDEIVAFAEIEKFIDTPVKHYSSGMYMRLAFAVAAHLEPEILVVDEVLAVGDAAFQKKCLGKMGDVARQGRTVLFVSHNMTAMQSLCNRIIWLDSGKIVEDGAAPVVASNYLQSAVSRASQIIWDDVTTAPGNSRARLRAVRILDANGKPADQVDITEPILIEIEYWNLVPDTSLNLSMSVFNQEDIQVLASPSMTDAEWYQRPHPAGLFRSRCVIPGSLLNQGRYSVTAILVQNGLHIVAQVDKVVSVEVLDSGATRRGFFGHWGGVVRPSLEWTTQCL